MDKFSSHSKQTHLVGHSWGSPGRLWCLETPYEAALHLWKDHIGLCSTLCVQIGFLFKRLQQTVAKPPCKVASNKTARMWCHMGLSYLALQALQRMLHKESKNLPAVEIQLQEMLKADFNLLFWWNRTIIREVKFVCVVSKDPLMHWLYAQAWDK